MTEASCVSNPRIKAISPQNSERAARNWIIDSLDLGIDLSRTRRHRLIASLDELRIMDGASEKLVLIRIPLTCWWEHSVLTAIMSE